MSFFGRGTLYIKLSSEQLYIRNIDTGNEIREKPLLAIRGIGAKALIDAVGNVAEEACRADDGLVLVNPFQHPRTLLADFNVAQRLMTYFYGTMGALKFFRPKPLIIFQPLEMLEGGLTQIEKRAFRELFLSAGAQKFIGWTGRTLTDDEIRTQSFAQESEVF